jgi:hypothetical protein
VENTSVKASAILGICVGLGVAIAGALVADALVTSRAAQRHVTVKGLAEREVDADLAIWPIAFKEVAQELTPLQKQVDASRAAIAAFLESAGFDPRDISFAAPRITDLHAEGAPGQRSQQFRYVALATVTVQSKDVTRVKRSMEQAGVLVSRGVMLAQDWEARPQFLFTGLNAVKPEMIEAATKAAREAAVKFAKDSGSRIGKIRNASQGLFTVSDRDPSSPERKVVRVVSTVEYFLED